MRLSALLVSFAVACGNASAPLEDASVPDADAGVMMTAGLTVPSGFQIETIAHVPLARQLAALPNGDLLVGTLDTSVYLIRDAENAGVPTGITLYTSINDAPVHSVVFVPSTSTIYFGSKHGVWAVPYVEGQIPTTPPTKIAGVRTMVDGGHVTSSVAFAGGLVFVGVGSSCDACTETDPSRAAISQMNPDGSGFTKKATRIRNAIALATNPDTGTLWAGGAGQDGLPAGHPYEYFDALTLHAGVADYGWPKCEENQNPYGSGADCSGTVVPLIEQPAYASLIGAAFYPMGQTGAYAFPAAYRGLYLADHGSWHMAGSAYVTPPRVVLVPMNGDAPVTPVDWSDPTKQWSEFVGGMQLADGMTRIARATGVAVGAQGSLFVGDDQAGAVYRVRPR